MQNPVNNFRFKNKRLGILINLVITCLLVLLSSINISAQEISVKASSSKSDCLIGDKIEVVIDVKMPENYNIIWYRQEPDTQHLELVDSIKRDSNFVNNKIELKYHITLAGFDSGKAIYPAQQFAFHKRGDTTAFRLKTDSIVFNIKTITVDLKKDIKPIVDPVEPGIDFLTYGIYLIIGLIVFILLAIGYVFWIKKLRRQDALLPVQIEIKRPPCEDALENLSELQVQDLPAKGKVKEFYIRLSDILRHYIHDVTMIEAMELTTNEMIDELSHTEISREFIIKVSQVLSLSDSVKFAKYTPTNSDNEESMDQAIKLVNSLRPENDMQNTSV